MSVLRLEGLEVEYAVRVVDEGLLSLGGEVMFWGVVVVDLDSWSRGW